MSAQFTLNSLTKVSRKTVYLSNLCSNNVCSCVPHLFWLTPNPKVFCNFIIKLWFDFPFIIYIRYRCYVGRHYSDIFTFFSFAVHLYEYCFWFKHINAVYLICFPSTSWWIFLICDTLSYNVLESVQTVMSGTGTWIFWKLDLMLFIHHHSSFFFH